MKRYAIALALVAIAVVAMAESMHHGSYGRHGTSFRDETRAIMSEYSDRVPSQLTFGEMEELAGALSIPAQKTAWVAKSSVASMIMPGAGQFMNGDAAAGSLFVAGDLAISAGTLVGLYYLLPAALRFDSLDYWNTPKSQIRSTWMAELDAMTFADSLPFAAVLTGGVILDSLLSHFAARHAGRLARTRIAAGEIEFEPRPEIVMMRSGHFGFGMKMSY